MASTQDITDAIKARLSTITRANGYNTDIGMHVAEWSPRLVEPRFDSVIFGDTDETFEDHNDRLKCVLTVEIQAVLFTIDYGTVGRQAKRDILTALYRDQSLGIHRVHIDARSSSMESAPDGRDVVFVYIKTEVTYYDDF